MEKKERIRELIAKQGILPLYYHKDTEVSIEVLRALYAAGVRTVEYTNRGEAALTNFKEMLKVRDAEMKDLLLGIGTIKTGESAQTFIDAGADFIISPGLSEAVAEATDKHNMLWIPGCMTPSEIMRAEALGAKMIKLFPGNVLGAGFMSAIREIFPELLFIPTGGVELNRDNIEGWLDAGVCAVGMGSKLVTRNMLETRDYAHITAVTKEALDLIISIRASR